MTIIKPDIIRGDQATIRVRDAVDVNGAAFDFTGWDVTFSATRWLGTPAVVTKTLANGITVIAAGSADVVLSAADTAALMDGTRAASVLVHWDVQVSRTGQGPHTLDSGTVTVRRDVS